MGRFADKIRSGGPVVGLMNTIPHRTMMEVLGFVGMDFAVVDLMFGPTDWEDLAAMIRGSQVFGLDAMVRIQAYPWSDEPDRRLAVDASRAFSLGATGVVFSSGQPKDVAQVVHAAEGWHKDLHIHPFSKEDFAEYASKVAQERYAIPLIESQDGVDNIDAILDIKGLKVLMFGISDLTHMFGHPWEYEHPEVWRFIDKTAEKARKRGIVLCGNTGYGYSKDLHTLGERAKRMQEHGIQIIWLQNLGFLVQWYLRDVINVARGIAVPSSPSS